MNSTRLSTATAPGPWLLALLPILALSALLTACGGSSSSATASTTTAAPTTAPGQASTASSFSKYTQCLTSHGVPASANGLFGRRGDGIDVGDHRSRRDGLDHPPDPADHPRPVPAGLSSVRQSAPHGRLRRLRRRRSQQCPGRGLPQLPPDPWREAADPPDHHARPDHHLPPAVINRWRPRRIRAVRPTIRPSRPPKRPVPACCPPAPGSTSSTTAATGS